MFTQKIVFGRNAVFRFASREKRSKIQIVIHLIQIKGGGGEYLKTICRLYISTIWFTKSFSVLLSFSTSIIPVIFGGNFLALRQKSYDHFPDELCLDRSRYLPRKCWHFPFVIFVVYVIYSQIFFTLAWNIHIVTNDVIIIRCKYQTICLSIQRLQGHVYHVK